MRQLDFYFDFVSPFSYIAFARLDRLPPDVEVRLKPVLFAGLLGHWGHTGPAELAPKRKWTYRWCHWWARSLGVPTYMVDGQAFWGADALDFVCAYLADAAILNTPETRRLDTLPVGAARAR